MRLLLVLAVAIVLGVCALWLVLGGRLEAEAGLGSNCNMPLPSLPAALVEPERIEAPTDGREPRGADALPVAGRIEVEGTLPPGLEGTVVALAHRTGVSRLHSLRLEAALAPDGTFGLEVPRGTSSVNLDVDSAVLYVPDEVEVRPGRRDVVLHAELQSALCGRVLVPPGESFTDVTIACCPRGSAPVDGQGEFCVRGLQADVPVEVDARTEHAGVHLTLAPLRRGELRRVTLVLESWPALRGRVLDEHGAPIDGVELALDGEPLSPPAADGSFVIASPAPGMHWLEAHAEGRDHVAGWASMPEAGEELLVVLGRPGVVRGRALAPDGSPCTHATVFVDPSPSSSVPAGTIRLRSSRLSADVDVPDASEHADVDDEGRFALDHDSGAVRLQAFADGWAPSAPLELELGSGETRADVVLRLRPGCRLRVRVRDADGAPLSAPLSFRSEDGTVLGLSADEDGTFEAADLPPGKGRLDFIWGRSTSPPGGVEVELAPELERVVELRAQAGGPLRVYGR